MNAAFGWIGMGLLLALAGCEDGAKGGDRTPKSPPRPVWEKHTLTLEGARGEATFRMASDASKEGPMVLEAYFMSFPPEAKLSVGSRQGVASSSGEYRTTVDVRQGLGKLALKDVIGGAVDLGLKIGVTLPDYPAMGTELPPISVSASLADALAEVQTHGLRFTGEPPHDGSATSAAVVGLPSAKRKLRVLGPADKVWDLDWIAVEERDESAREKPCGGYHRRIDVVLKMHDGTIKVYDRRIGGVVREKDFAAPSQCPREPLLNPDGSTHSYIRPDDVDAWLREELGSKKP